jgi:subtilisin-like proprotein convertase family protein
VKDFVWDTGTELHATYTVDASALPANGTWKLRVTDNTPGIFTVDPGYLDSWSLTFCPCSASSPTRDVRASRE